MTHPYFRKLIAGYCFMFVSMQCFYLSQWTARFLCPWCVEMWSEDMISFHKAFVFDLNIFYCKKKMLCKWIGHTLWKQNSTSPSIYTCNNNFNNILKTEHPPPPPPSQGKLQCQETYEIYLRNYIIEKLFPNRGILWTRKKEKWWMSSTLQYVKNIEIKAHNYDDMCWSLHTIL